MPVAQLEEYLATNQAVGSSNLSGHVYFFHNAMISLSYVLLASVLYAASCVQESMNTTDLPEYMRSGNYRRDVNAAVHDFSLRFELWHSQQVYTKKPAIIVDVDETLLSNAYYFSEVNYAPNTKTFYAYLANPHTVPITSVVSFVNKLAKLRYEVFVVTGRPKRFCAITASQLANIGFHVQYKKLFCNENDESPVSYKQRVLSGIVDQGYEIVMHINDQCSELNIGHIAWRLKLPNPFYKVH